MSPYTNFPHKYTYIYKPRKSTLLYLFKKSPSERNYRHHFEEKSRNLKIVFICKKSSDTIYKSREIIWKKIKWENLNKLI